MREEKKREVSEVGCAGMESKLVSAEVYRPCSFGGAMFPKPKPSVSRCTLKCTNKQAGLAATLSTLLLPGCRSSLSVVREKEISLKQTALKFSRKIETSQKQTKKGCLDTRPKRKQWGER